MCTSASLSCLLTRQARLPLSRYQLGVKASQRRFGTATILSGRAVALQCWIHLGVDGTFASSGSCLVSAYVGSLYPSAEGRLAKAGRAAIVR